MKIDRPLWAAGALLSPQQFQQQARWEAWANEQLAHLSLVHPWGVQATGFDSDALRLGTLKATLLRARMPDGTLIDSDGVDRLPAGLELSRLLPDKLQAATVLLALPLEQANGNNCLFDTATADRPTRYRQDWRQVQDIYADEVQSVGVLEHVLSLRFDHDENGDYLTCPVARLIRDGQAGWTLDADFVPPLLHFSAHPGLVAQLDNLFIQLSAKRQRLMGSLSQHHPVSLAQGTPLGSVGQDANSQLHLALFTRDPTEARDWLPGAQLHSDLLVLLRVYLGWRCTAKLQLSLPTRSLPQPLLGRATLLLGMTAVLGSGSDTWQGAEHETITLDLGRYQGLSKNPENKEVQHVAYRW